MREPVRRGCEARSCQVSGTERGCLLHLVLEKTGHKGFGQKKHFARVHIHPPPHVLPPELLTSMYLPSGRLNIGCLKYTVEGKAKGKVIVEQCPLLISKGVGTGVTLGLWLKLLCLNSNSGRITVNCWI